MTPFTLAVCLFLLAVAYVVMTGLTDVTYPTSLELREVEQVLLPTLTQDDAIFDEFPIVDSEESKLRWEQKDNYQGLQQVRGYNGPPKFVRRVGAKVYEMEPGVYGDFSNISEHEITRRRNLGSFDQPISIDDLTTDAQVQLLQRRLDRIRWILWTLVTSGTFTVTDAAGLPMHYDTFPLKTQTAAVPWATVATATPTTDIRAAQIQYRGQSVDFGAKATIYANLTTINNLLQNTNPNDLFGRRINGGATVNNLEEYNAILVGNSLPKLAVYDKGYYDDAGTFQTFIPNGKAVMFGARQNGARLGEYRMTRNANNQNAAPGAYTRVVDWGEFVVPRQIDVHDGHNGGPVIFFPGAIVVFTVA